MLPIDLLRFSSSEILLTNNGESTLCSAMTGQERSIKSYHKNHGAYCEKNQHQVVSALVLFTHKNDLIFTNGSTDSFMIII